MTMTLSELCDPLFLEICRLNRLARKGAGASCDPGSVSAQIEGILEKVKSGAAADVALQNQYHLVERPLVYFVDFMISESQLPWAHGWPSLEEKLFDELVGQQKFFELLDATMADASPAAAERLEVFYTCLGLGFTGFYSDDPQFIRKKMLEIKARILRTVETDPSARIVPESALHANTSTLYEPPGRGLTILGLALVALILVLLGVNFWFYHREISGLETTVEAIGTWGPEPGPPLPGGPAVPPAGTKGGSK
jgi:type VI protein secretion system component VasF